MSSNKFRTTIKYWQTDDDHWKATEPAADHNLVGRGATATEAVRNYAAAMDEHDPRTEVSADD